MKTKANIEGRPVSRQAPESAVGSLVGNGTGGACCGAKTAGAGRGGEGARAVSTFKRTLVAPDLKRRGRFLAKDSSQGLVLQFPENAPGELTPSARRCLDRERTPWLQYGVPSLSVPRPTARRRVAAVL